MLACTPRYLSTGVFAEDAGRDDPTPCTVDEYPSAVARLIAYPEPHFVFFRADDDPATGIDTADETPL